MWTTKTLAVFVVTALNVLTGERALFTDLLLSAVRVGFTINVFADIFLTFLLFTTVIVACAINLSTDLVQKGWMGLADVSTIVTIINEWSKSLTV